MDQQARISRLRGEVNEALHEVARAVGKATVLAGRLQEARGVRARGEDKVVTPARKARKPRLRPYMSEHRPDAPVAEA